MRDNVRTLTGCAVFTALGSALLYVASFLPTLSLTLAAASGLAAAAAVIHYRLGAGFAVYFATAALSALIAPDKGNVVLYAIFFGVYPVLKSPAERPEKAVFRWLLKLLYFNLVFAGIWLFARELLFDELPQFPALWLIAAVAANAVFVLYDVGMTRLISYYTYKVAHKIM